MNTTQIPIDNINICFVGGVSTGKSTVLNSIFCEKLTQCKIKRTTMVPTVYVENAKSRTTPSEIYRIIEEKNKEIIEKTELGQKLDEDAYKELAFNVGKLDINILGDTGIFVNVYDVPGLNDARTQDVYYNYLETNFHKFNLIVFLVDIHSGLNTADEMRMLKFIATNTRHHIDCDQKRNIHTLVIVNKADDMQDSNSDDPNSKMVITGELSEMFAQTETTVRHEFAECGLEDNLIDVIPLCAIDAYLYRMIKKHGAAFELSAEHVLKIGVNENGKKFSTKKPEVQRAEVAQILKKTDFIDTMIKLSGFKGFTDALHDFLNTNNQGRRIRYANLQYEMNKLDPVQDMPVCFLADLVSKYADLYEKMFDIDPVETDHKVQAFVNSLIDILNIRIRDWTYDEEALVQFYDAYIKKVIVPRFSQYYNTAEPNEPLKKRVFGMICESCRDSLCVRSLNAKLQLLKRIDQSDKESLECVFNTITQNFREKDTVDFSTTNMGQINKLMETFNDCIKTGVNMSRILRFLVINQMHSEGACAEPNYHYIKHMLYAQTGELIVSNYLLKLVQTEFTMKPSFDAILRGLPKNAKLYGLDEYYVKYEIVHGLWNFSS